MNTHSNTKLQVTYMDGKDTHQTTMGRLKKRLQESGFGSEYIDNIMDSLTLKGRASTALADYEIIKIEKP